MNNQSEICAAGNWRAVSNSIRFGASFILLLILFCINDQLHGQEVQKPIRISNSVGDTLDAAERDLYNLFPGVEDYRYAVYILDRDSSLTARVTVAREGGEQVLLFPKYERLGSFLMRIHKVENDSSRTGRDVKLLLADSTWLIGELLSAGDSAIIIQPDMSSTQQNILLIPRYNIYRITIEGESKILKRALTGTLSGVVIGAALGYVSGRGEHILFSPSTSALIGAGGIGAIGLCLGVISGISSSTKDEVFFVRDDFRMSSLRTYAKFPFRKPDDFGINR
jgi:hypothetical protein